MPRLKTKSGEASQVKPSMKITIVYPDELLRLCDEVAGVRHLERNDIIRQAIATGLLVMQAENLGLSGRDDGLDLESMPRPMLKPSTKITIALPSELMEWASMMAVVRHLDRNDVIREATASGVFSMVAENMRLSGRGAELDAWFAARGAGPQEVQDYSDRVGGMDGFVEKVRGSIAQDVKKVTEQG